MENLRTAMTQTYNEMDIRDMWLGALYGGFRAWTSAKKGKFGEQILKRALEMNGVEYRHVIEHNEWDVETNENARIECKVICMSPRSTFKVQKLNLSSGVTDYFMVCVTPREMRGYLIPVNVMHDAIVAKLNGPFEDDKVEFDIGEINSYFTQFEISQRTIV